MRCRQTLILFVFLAHSLFVGSTKGTEDPGFHAENTPINFSLNDDTSYDLSGEWIIQYETTHTHEHVKYCEYDEFGELISCEEWDEIDEELDVGVVFGTVSQYGNRLEGTIINKSDEELHLSGTIIGTHMEFTLLLEGETYTETIPELDYMYYYTCTDIIVKCEGTYHPDNGILYTTFEAYKEREYQENWHSQGHTSDETTNSIESGTFTIGLHGKLPPIACFEARFNENQTRLLLDGSCSRDPDGGSILNYCWKFKGESGFEFCSGSDTYELPIEGYHTGIFYVGEKR